MSNGKKGMPIWAWFGIGCGVITLIAVVVLVAVMVFAVGKAKDIAGEFEDNPEVAAARMIVKLNPEIEEVDVDKENGTITVREKSSGKEYTVSVADIKEGKFSIQGEDGGMVFSAEGDADGEGVKITTDKGEMTFSGGGAGAASKAPEWVPALPDQKVLSQQNMTANGSSHGAVQIGTELPTEEVFSFYTKAMQDAGFTTENSSFSNNEDSTRIAQFRDSDAGRTLILAVATNDGERTVNLTYSEGK